MSYTPPLKVQKTAFGELAVAEPTPIVQMIAEASLFPKGRTANFGAGDAGAVDNLFFASSGAQAGSGGNIFTERQVHYRAGQGALIRGTAIFDTPVSGNRQNFGGGTAGDGFLFSYNTSGVFGVERLFDGHVIIQKLTITTPASGGENATITIDGTGYTVPLTAGTTVHNTNEITDSLNSQIPNWRFSQNNGFVIGRSLFPTPAVGAFTLSSATAEGTFEEIADGVEVTRDFIAQTDWNADKMDGTGVSGMTLNQQKGNVYQIQFEYLGFGAINFFIENENTGSFQLVHQIKYTNNNTSPSVGSPTFRIVWGCTNTTNDTNVTLRGSSCAGFIEGKTDHTDSGKARNNTKSVPTTGFTNLLTIRNRTVFGTNVNLNQVLPMLVSVFADTAKGAIVNISKGTPTDPITLSGTPDFIYEDETNSIIEYDVSGVLVTEGRLIHSFVAGHDVEADLSAFQEILLSGETLTVSARVISGSSANVTATLNWDEDL